MSTATVIATDRATTHTPALTAVPPADPSAPVSVSPARVIRTAGQPSAIAPALVRTAPAPPAPSPGGPDSDIDPLGDEIALLCAHITAATYRLLRLLAVYDAEERWQGFCSCAHWLSWRTGISLGPAREKVRVARRMDRDDASQAARAERRGLSVWVTDDGSYEVRGRLNPEVGSRVSAETSSRLVCDAEIVPIRRAGDGSVLDVGRRRRTVGWRMRKALACNASWRDVRASRCSDRPGPART